jgi:hypothetical protein
VTEIVNLNHARKAKARAAAVVQARQNRLTFGLTKTQKAAARSETAKAGAALDGHKREP